MIAHALIRLLLLLGFVAALSVVPSLASPIEAGLIVEDALTFTLSNDGADDSFSFLIYSKGRQVSETYAKVLEVRDPKGLSLDRDRIAVSLENGVVTPDGARVTLKPDRRLFTTAGDYRVILSITGKSNNQSVKSLVTLTIKQPTAEINLDALKNHTVELSRSWPGGAASGKYSFVLQETTGKAGLEDLQITAQVQPLFLENRKVLVPGRIIATPRYINLGQPSQAGQGQWELEIDLSGVERTGTLTTELLLNSPRFSTAKSIPLNVAVSDRWGFAVFVILLGVSGGFLTNYVSEKWQPRQRNRLKILTLRDLAKKFQRSVLDPDKSARLQTAREELNRAEEETSQGDFSGAKARLEKVEKDLGDFQKEQITEQAQLYDDLTALRSEIDEYRQGLSNPTEEETQALTAFKNALADGRIEGLLEEDKIDEAKRLLKQSQTPFLEFKKRRLTRDLEALKKQLEQTGTVNEVLTIQKELVAKHLDETAGLIREGNIDDARANLDGIEASIKTLITRLPKGFMDSYEYTPRSPLLPKALESHASQRTHVQILEPTAIRTAASAIHFELVDPEALTKDGDILRWDFGDGEKTINSTTKKVSHSFEETGKYYVKVDILRGESDIINVFMLPVSILPGSNEQKRSEISSSIRRSDLLISAIALVLATLTGLIYLYVGHAFGSLQDYLLAFLWGFGIDSSVRGFTSVLNKAQGREA